MHPTFQLVEGDQVTGPHSLAVLRQKADIHVITPDTPARPVAHPPEPWRPIRDWPELHALLFAAKTSVHLRDARFHSTNAQTDADSDPIDVQDILRGNAAAQKTSELRETNATPTPDPYARRRRLFAVTAALVVLPAAAICFLLLPGTQGVITATAGIVLSALAVIYWIMFHVLDPR